MPARRSGFTLLELVIVIAIIALLASIAVPAFMGVRRKAKTANCQSDVKDIVTGIAMMMHGRDAMLYLEEHGKAAFPDELDYSARDEQALEVDGKRLTYRKNNEEILTSTITAETGEPPYTVQVWSPTGGPLPLVTSATMTGAL